MLKLIIENGYIVSDDDFYVIIEYIGASDFIKKVEQAKVFFGKAAEGLGFKLDFDKLN